MADPLSAIGNIFAYAARRGHRDGDGLSPFQVTFEGPAVAAFGWVPPTFAPSLAITGQRCLSFLIFLIIFATFRVRHAQTLVWTSFDLKGKKTRAGIV